MMLFGGGLAALGRRCAGFLGLWQAGAPAPAWFMGFSRLWLVLLQSSGSRVGAQ